MEQQIPIQQKQVPVGVKIISVLYFIAAILLIILGALFIVGAGLVSILAEQISILSLIGTGAFVIVGIIFIGLGILGFFVGIGLWKGRGWARILAIIFSVIGIIVSSIEMYRGQTSENIFGLIISLVILVYLLFSKKVKVAFA